MGDTPDPTKAKLLELETRLADLSMPDHVEYEEEGFTIMECGKDTKK